MFLRFPPIDFGGMFFYTVWCKKGAEAGGCRTPVFTTFSILSRVGVFCKVFALIWAPFGLLRAPFYSFLVSLLLSL